MAKRKKQPTPKQPLTLGEILWRIALVFAAIGFICLAISGATGK